MRQLTAVVTVVLLACLGFAGVGNAQTQQLVQVQGTIQAVDCQGQQLTVNTSGGASTFPATNQTAVFVNGTAAQLCSLGSYIGAPATVSVVPTDSQFVLDEVDVTAPQTAAQPQPAPAAVSSSNTSSVALIALGALLLGGLAYVIGHNSAANSNAAPAPSDNWFGSHQSWTANCNAAPDQRGQWGRQAQWNNWCQQNQRFRNSQPDQQWRQGHPWDTGRPGDRG